MSFIRCRKSAFKSNFPWDLKLKKFALDHDLVPDIASRKGFKKVISINYRFYLLFRLSRPIFGTLRPFKGF